KRWTYDVEANEVGVASLLVDDALVVKGGLLAFELPLFSFVLELVQLAKGGLVDVVESQGRVGARARRTAEVVRRLAQLCHQLCKSPAHPDLLGYIRESVEFCGLLLLLALCRGGCCCWISCCDKRW